MEAECNGKTAFLRVGAGAALMGRLLKEQAECSHTVLLPCAATAMSSYPGLGRCSCCTDCTRGHYHTGSIVSYLEGPPSLLLPPDMWC